MMSRVCRSPLALSDARSRATAAQQGAAVRHLRTCFDQLASIVTDGVRSGELAPRDVTASARALFDATSAFHNPRRVPDTAADPHGPARLEALSELLVAGLTVPPRSG